MSVYKLFVHKIHPHYSYTLWLDGILCCCRFWSSKRPLQPGLLSSGRWKKTSCALDGTRGPATRQIHHWVRCVVCKDVILPYPAHLDMLSLFVSLRCFAFAFICMGSASWPIGGSVARIPAACWVLDSSLMRLIWMAALGFVCVMLCCVALLCSSVWVLSQPFSGHMFVRAGTVYRSQLHLRILHCMYSTCMRTNMHTTYFLVLAVVVAPTHACMWQHVYLGCPDFQLLYRFTFWHFAKFSAH